MKEYGFLRNVKGQLALLRCQFALRRGLHTKTVEENGFLSIKQKCKFVLQRGLRTKIAEGQFPEHREVPGSDELFDWERLVESDKAKVEARAFLSHQLEEGIKSNTDEIRNKRAGLDKLEKKTRDNHKKASELVDIKSSNLILISRNAPKGGQISTRNTI